MLHSAADQQFEAGSLLSGGDKTDYGAVSNLSLLDTVDSPITLSWQDIRVSAPKINRDILHGVSGIANPGELVALMGASGAGKTTLLNTLVARNLKGLQVDGSVKVNGKVIGREITSVSGYAQQEELFVGTLTVKEYLSIQARLRVVEIPESKKGTATSLEEYRKNRVLKVLANLNLLKCQNTRIGVIGVKKGISGGEARRLTFACELLSNPALLFCDEPTTGLDSFMAESVIHVLSTLSTANRTIICTIHQPSSQLYSMFNKVIFLACGKTAFLGSPTQAIEFFASCGHVCPRNYNPADLIIHKLAVVPNEEDECIQRIEDITRKFEQSVYGTRLDSQLASVTEGRMPEKRRQANICTQINALLQRATIDTVRNPSLARAKMIQKSVMGLFVGLLYFQTKLDAIGVTNINGALFYLVCELTYSTLFGILNFLPSDFPLVAREYHDGLYSVLSYYVARCLSYLPLFTIDGLAMLLISYWLVGFQSAWDQVLLACLISFLIEQSSSAFGIMLSCVSPSFPIAMSSAGPLLTLLSLTGGLYANVGALPSFISWIQYLSWFRYGFEAFTINQWRKVDSPNWNSTNTQEVMQNLSFTESMFLWDMVIMAAYIVFFYTIGYIGLLIRIRRAR
ncbi:hypothetical protein WR25_14910 [Diploscapter pachys]|uniref:ABC transporter domain-containing protein n=1 Tax=Diploscapter pachys TaxID=2018661 RepID=A0A2A2J4E0_9BILA|nr:hypothetical protein WR25_14910 [Diploscapter pachys]